MVIGARHIGQPRLSSSIFVIQEPQKRWCPQGTSACRVSLCYHADFAKIQRSNIGWRLVVATVNAVLLLLAVIIIDVRLRTEHY